MTTAVAYHLEIVDQVRDWLHQLRRTDREIAILVGQAIAALLEEGAGSTEIRILFIFDPARNSVLLVAGGKAGQWTAWYSQAIPPAEARYAIYLKEREQS